MSSIRVLCVDDDPGIRETLPAMLEKQGFEVKAVASVPEALSEISSRTFDILISDLNIGEPGDGFTIVSAMRRTHPECINFIMTGYPALESALQALRSHVDEYLIKPADMATVVASINEKLQNRTPEHRIPTKRVQEVLRENVEEIAKRTLQAMKSEPLLAQITLSDAERIGPFQPVLTQLAEMLNSSESNETPPDLLLQAWRRGQLRYKQGYSLVQLIMNIHLLECSLFEVIHEQLLSMDLSFLMVDIRRLHRSLALQLQVSIQGYFEAAGLKTQRAS